MVKPSKHIVRINHLFRLKSRELGGALDDNFPDTNH